MVEAFLSITSPAVPVVHRRLTIMKVYENIFLFRAVGAIARAAREFRRASELRRHIWRVQKGFYVGGANNRGISKARGAAALHNSTFYAVWKVAVRFSRNYDQIIMFTDFPILARRRATAAAARDWRETNRQAGASSRRN